jgi:rhomboid protease GluP
MNSTSFRSVRRMQPQDTQPPQASAPPAPRRPSLLSYLVPRKNFWGVAVLVDVNIAVYLAMVLSGLGVMEFSPQDLVTWGGNYGPALEGIGLYRLVTSTFVHAGLLHIATNMYGLLLGGLFIAPAARNGWLIFCYLFCGVCGSIASALMHPDAVSVGASGAIFGLFGMLFVLAGLGDYRFATVRRSLFANAAFIIVINLALSATIPGIDISAHIGGLIAGCVLGLVFFLTGRRAMSA